MSIAAAAWGAPVNGVRLQIALTGNPQPEIGITAQNVDSKPLLLPIGALIGDGFYDIRPVLVLTAPGGKDRRAVYTCDPGVVGGRVDPLVVPLLPKSSYTLEISVACFSLPDAPGTLEAFLHKPFRWRVELNVENAVCPLYGYPNPNMIPCWRGKAVSNIL